ncbi:hypothetical protein ACGFRB_08305 [Streptomyces sp. NPDC048718]|uniref:hypothetical protein n=1 Tax=Streptomyces sp. NPDC048718 TaxID=3365587 RepID=UPI00371CFD20
MNSRTFLTSRPLLLPLALPLALALTGCGSVIAGAPSQAELEERAGYAQLSLDHVYVTEIEGFTLARQSVGVMGDDGFQATYVAKDGTQVTLGADRGTFTDQDCAASPKSAPCAPEKPGWYRTSDGQHTYIRVEDGVRITLGAPLTVGKDRLRAAAERAHRADARELDDVLPEKPAGGGAPVQRGDLPAEGDGAPDNSVGVGG